jgi:mono/diheme cytochrome c family protein
MPVRADIIGQYDKSQIRIVAFLFSVALALFEGHTAFAQDIQNGQRLSERWCAECHAIGTPTARTKRVVSFASIAEKPDINSEVIASFLLMPHATMPNPPLSRKDAQDIAAFIMKMKR